jgi:hypothetical protein
VHELMIDLEWQIKFSFKLQHGRPSPEEDFIA